MVGVILVGKGMVYLRDWMLLAVGFVRLRGGKSGYHVLRSCLGWHWVVTLAREVDGSWREGGRALEMPRRMII